MSSSESSSSTSSAAVVANTRKRPRETNSKYRTESDFSVSDTDTDDSSSDESPKPQKVADKPVLSHAEKRRKKRKDEKHAAETLNQDTDASVHPTKKRKLKDGSSKAVVDPPAKSTRQNSVWVGNLVYKTQQSDLRTFFKDVGEITRINLPTKVATGPGKKPDNRGFAYVDFATPEAKVAAIALSEHPLLGRKLLIKDGDSFEGRPATVAGENVITDPSVAQKTHSKTAQKILSVQKQPAAPTLFFGNLPFETTEDDIRQLLDAHRPRNKQKDGAEEEGEQPTKDDWIRKVRMGTFEDSGLCKGFAFVDFTSVDNATTALINPKNHRLNGRSLVVEYASPDAVRRGAPKTGKLMGGAQKRTLPSAHEKMTAAEPEKAPVNEEPDKTTKSRSSTFHEHERLSHLDRKMKEREGESASRQDKAPNNITRQPGFKSRAKPGAALAQAKRETIAIVPSQGKKIVF